MLYGSKGIDISVVTKSVGGNRDIANTLVNCGFRSISDSRISNLKKMHVAGIKAHFLLVRTPLMSQVEAVIKYANASLNSELQVINRLSENSLKNNTTHEIILMIELGDLREGIMPEDLDATVKQILKLDGVVLKGIGTNLACFGGINPDQDKMEYLSLLATRIEKKFNLELDLISGGNSANYNWFKSTKNVGRINHLRLGESIFLGCEPLERKPISGLFTDAFTLIAEVIELKVKPSVPYGKKSQNAFGEIPSFQDKDQMKRAIMGFGLQDVMVSGLKPRINIQLLGASSDHTIVDANQVKLTVGDQLEFDLNYAALFSAMNSPYVIKMKKSNTNSSHLKNRRHVNTTKK